MCIYAYMCAYACIHRNVFVRRGGRSPALAVALMAYVFLRGRSRALAVAPTAEFFGGAAEFFGGGRPPTLVVAPTDHVCGGVAPRVCIHTSSLTAMLASMQSRGGACIYICFVCLEYDDDHAIETMGVSMV